MGDEDQRGAVLAVQREQQVGDFIPGVTVEVAGGFIGEQQLRAAVKRARQRDPLLLAAGELYRQVMQAFAQPQLLQQRLALPRLWLSLSPRSSAGSSTFSSALRVGISIKD